MDSQSNRRQHVGLGLLLSTLGLCGMAVAQEPITKLPSGGFAKANELSIEAAWPVAQVVAPGEALRINAKVRNDGFAAAQDVVARMCLSSGNCITLA